MPRDLADSDYPLIAELRQIARWFREEPENSDKLSITSTGLCMLIADLNTNPTIFRENPTAPFEALAYAAHEWSEGGRPALFGCGRARHRPASDGNLEAACMVAIDVQMPAKISLEEAADIVSDELKRGGCVVESKKIQRWRKDFPTRATARARDWRATLRSVHPAITTPTTDRDIAIQHARKIIRTQLATGF